jgi:hypothetical protein
MKPPNGLHWPDAPQDPDDIAIAICANLIAWSITPVVTFAWGANGQAVAVEISDPDCRRFHARIPIHPMSLSVEMARLMAAAIIKQATRKDPETEKAR